jgi:hypothetical protein
MKIYNVFERERSEPLWLLKVDVGIKHTAGFIPILSENMDYAVERIIKECYDESSYAEDVLDDILEKLYDHGYHAELIKPTNILI